MSNDLPSVGTEDARRLAGELSRYGRGFQDGAGMFGEAATMLRALASERDELASRVRELEGALKEAVVIIDGALYCGHELNSIGKEKLSRCRATLSATHRGNPRAASEPVAYLVTGPYEKVAFADFGSASSFCKGLNKGFDEAAYIVRPLYTTPESKP